MYVCVCVYYKMWWLLMHLLLNLNFFSRRRVTCEDWSVLRNI